MSDDDVIVIDKERLEKKKRKIAQGGAEKLQVVSDFDKTLTACFVGGKKIVSLISILRDENYLTQDYSQKAYALYNKYAPIEKNPKIPLEEKKRLMHEWWMAHYGLLIESGLSRGDLERVARSAKLALRPGAVELIDFLYAHQIPLVILSASGMGAETIGLYLRQHDKFYDNIKIASNEFIFKDDKVVGVKEPIIHTFNKDYTSVKKFPFFAEIAQRRNVVLLGDSAADADMINGFDYDNLIKVGFLNENEKGELANYEKNYDVVILHDGSMDYVLESFKKAFDAIILNDGPMDFVNSLMRELISI